MTDTLPEGVAYKVEEAWATNLEPGTWYRIVDAVRPRIVCGFVFVPARGPIDYREIDGKKISKRVTHYAAITRAWEAAISRFKGETL